jgi:hypothetical protein
MPPVAEPASVVKNVRVVVASPSDVKEERAITHRVADKLNDTLCPSLGIRVEVHMWENTSYPGVHAEGPQALIDPILSIEESDIFIGIFWKRFGTQTKSGLTGTEHEIRTAYDSWRGKNAPHIMIYFKQQAFKPSSKEEAEQWGKVLQFQQEISETTLSWNYVTTEEFEQVLENHLTKLLKEKFRQLATHRPFKDPGRHDDSPTDREAAAVAEALQIAVTHALQHAWFCLAHPYSIGLRPTSRTKITDFALEDDPTELMDQVTSDAIYHALTQLAVSGHPLSTGWIHVDEEQGARTIATGNSSKSQSNWIILIDSSDDTAAMSKGLGGTIEAAAYYKGSGWIASVVADFVRCRLYTRVRRSKTTAIELSLPEAATLPRLKLKPPHGSVVPLAPSRRQSLKGASICIYMGKPGRVLKTAEQARNLLSERTGIKEIHSHGGGRGPILVAEGLIDGSVEFVKGFKYLDSVPGMYLADGAGAVVRELTGHEINFGVDTAFENIFSKPTHEQSQALEGLRRRFIVAATPELAEELLKATNVLSRSAHFS